MEIVTVEEFLRSREAAEAELGDIDELDAKRAIAEAYAELTLELGYKVLDEAATVSLYGNGQGFAWLPSRVRVTSTPISVSVAGEDLEDSDYYVASDGFMLVRSQSDCARYWDRHSLIVLTGAFGYDPGHVPDDEDDEARDPDPQFVLAQKAVRLLAARSLIKTDPDGSFPGGMSGAELTGYSTESTSFTFSGRNQDVAKIIEQIGVHPQKKDKVMMSLGGTSPQTPTSDVSA